MAKVPGVLLGVAILCTAAPLSAQDAPWVNQWFWGAQAGAQRFKTPEGSASWETGYTFGAHWLITGGRMGLYLSFDHITYNTAQSVVSDPIAGTVLPVVFDNGRYIQADLFAMPLKGQLQVLVGAGFTLHTITDATATGAFATQADQALAQALVDDAANRAFFNIMGELQFMLGRRAAAYVSYEFIPATDNFLLNGDQHSFGGGIRYSFGGRKEEVSTGR